MQTYISKRNTDWNTLKFNKITKHTHRRSTVYANTSQRLQNVKRRTAHYNSSAERQRKQHREASIVRYNHREWKPTRTKRQDRWLCTFRRRRPFEVMCRRIAEMAAPYLRVRRRAPPGLRWRAQPLCERWTGRSASGENVKWAGFFFSMSVIFRDAQVLTRRLTTMFFLWIIYFAR